MNSPKFNKWKFNTLPTELNKVQMKNKEEYALENGFKYSDTTKCVYNPNGSLYGLHGELDDDQVIFERIYPCFHCLGEKTIHYHENGFEDAGFEVCTICDDNGNVLETEEMKIIQ